MGWVFDPGFQDTSWNACIPYESAWIQVPALLPIPVSCKCTPSEAAGDCSSLGPYHLCGRTGLNSSFLDSAGPNPRCYKNLRSEPAMNTLSLSVSTPFKRGEKIGGASAVAHSIKLPPAPASWHQFKSQLLYFQVPAPC